MIIAQFSQVLSAEKPAFQRSLVELLGQGTRSSFKQCITAPVDLNFQPNKLLVRYQNIYARYVVEWRISRPYHMRQ